MEKTQHPEIQPVADIEEPLNRLYAMYGSILLELGKLDEAGEALSIDGLGPDECRHRF